MGATKTRGSEAHGCMKGKRAPAFARADKLTAHIRATHGRGGGRAICPAGGCGDQKLELDLLGVHIKLHHLTSKHEGVTGAMLRGVANGVSAEWRRCPVWWCKERVRVEGFTGHVLGHRSEEVETVREALGAEGYRVVEERGCCVIEGEEERRVRWMEVECPVCGSWEIGSI